MAAAKGAGHGKIVLTKEQKVLAQSLTKLQRLVVLGVVSGKSQRQAYFDAGGTAKSGSSADATVCAILKNPKAAAFRQLFIDSAVEKAGITLEDLLQELEEARAAASSGEKPQAAAMVAATLGKAKLLGLEAPQKVAHSGTIGVASTVTFIDAPSYTNDDDDDDDAVADE